MVGERLLQRASARRPRARPSTVSIVAPSAWTASSMQLFTSVPLKMHRAGAAVAGVAADVRAGQVEVVAEEVDEQPARLDLALVASSPLTSTVIVAAAGSASTRLLSRRLPRLRARRAPRRDGAGSRPTRGRPTGGSSVAPRPAHRRRAPALAALGRRSGSTAHDGHRVDAADRDARSACRSQRRGGVDDARAVLADRHRREAVALAARRDRDLRQQLARPDGGHVDAEEELLRRHRRARRPRRRSSSSRRARRAAAASGSSGRSSRRCRRSCRGCAPGRRRSARPTSARIGRARAPRRTDDARCRSPSRRARACRRRRARSRAARRAR